ncbi:MAG: hypothetical protein ACRDQZ_19365 [Mycobacteriales bacterium]
MEHERVDRDNRHVIDTGRCPSGRHADADSRTTIEPFKRPESVRLFAHFGEGVAAADSGAVEMMLLFIVNTLVQSMQRMVG